MQELHDQLATLQVIAADKYDPARVIQELRRICVELGAPHLPEKLWAEALKPAVYIRHRTPTDVLGGEAPLEVWENKPLGSIKHMHECGLLAFKHIEIRHRNGKLTPRVKKMHLVEYNTKNITYGLWDPERPYVIANSAQVMFREKSALDVGRRKAGYDPFPDPGTLCQASRLKKYSNENLPRSQWRLRYNRHSSAKATGSKVYNPTVSRRSNGLSLLT